MNKIVNGDIFYVEKAVDKKMKKDTTWKVVKYDVRNKHYELKNIDPKTKKEISGRVAVSFDLIELEGMIRRHELSLV